MDENKWFHNTANSMKNKYFNYHSLTSSFWWSFLRISDEFSLLSNAFTTRVKLWILAWKKIVVTIVPSWVFLVEKFVTMRRVKEKLNALEGCWKNMKVSETAHVCYLQHTHYCFERVDWRDSKEILINPGTRLSLLLFLSKNPF